MSVCVVLPWPVTLLCLRVFGPRNGRGFLRHKSCSCLFICLTRILCIVHTFKHNYIYVLVHKEIQLHVSVLLVDHLQVELLTYILVILMCGAFGCFFMICLFIHLLIHLLIHSFIYSFSRLICLFTLQDVSH